jgi:hypothetical protein
MRQDHDPANKTPTRENPKRCGFREIAGKGGFPAVAAAHRRVMPGTDNRVIVCCPAAKLLRPKLFRTMLKFGHKSGRH